MKPKIAGGIKFGYSIYQSSDGKFHASLSKKARHTYGAHTRLGKRTVWKEFASIEVGTFDNRKEAADRCRDEIEGRLMAYCIKNPQT